MKKPSWRSMVTFALTIAAFAACGYRILYDYYTASQLLGPDGEVLLRVGNDAIIRTIENWGLNICFTLLVVGICLIAWISRIMKCMYSIKGYIDERDSKTLKACDKGVRFDN